MINELIQLIGTSRIYHRSPMQTKKSQPEGKQIMRETRFTEFTALSIGLHCTRLIIFLTYKL